MDITQTPGEGTVRVALRGRLDASWSNHVQEVLADCVRAGQHVIELDLSEVAFLSSAGIRVLLVTYRQLHAIDGRLAVIAVSSEVQQVIELAGLRMLLAAAPAAEPASVAPAPARFERDGLCGEVHPLAAAARIALRTVGDPSAWLGDQRHSAAVVHESFPPSRLAVGVGAFGGTPAECRERLGELLALAGAAVTLPTNSEGRPDWMVCEERLVPEAHLAYGLVGDGEFAHLLRFEAPTQARAIGLDALVGAALDIVRSDAVAIAMVAEAAELVGAALRRSPADQAGDVFAFPAIRDQLDFTAEPAHADSVAVIAGVASRRPPASLAAHLRPIVRDGALVAHLHAAVFSYRPIRRGYIALEATVRELFETQPVLDLLHLLHDWRPGIGAGQSSFHRGALWCAPVEFGTTDEHR